MLITMGDMLREARSKNYAVAAPNVWNEGSVRASIQAAENCKSPVILNFFFQKNDPKPMQTMQDQMKFSAEWAKRAAVPVAINLDHGAKFEHAMWAICGGATSVMVDRSTLPYEENVAEVLELTRIAHSVNVSVEAELGHVGQGSNYEHDGKSLLTEPEEAARFISDTGVDCLAVAIGTAHGPYSGVPHIDFERLEEIRQATDVPLVLHGGSGTGDENLAKATKSGINKVNLFTDLVVAGTEKLKAEGFTSYRIQNLENIMFDGFREKLEYYMNLFGSANQG